MNGFLLLADDIIYVCIHFYFDKKVDTKNGGGYYAVLTWVNY